MPIVFLFSMNPYFFWQFIGSYNTIEKDAFGLAAGGSGKK